MTGQTGSARFQALLGSALEDYEKKAGVTLAGSEDPLAIRLQRCNSIDGITILLQDKTQAFNDFRQRDRILKSIEATVSILAPISSVASVADAAGLVRETVLNAFSLISDRFYRNYSRMRKRYILLSASYWTYVPFLSSYVDVLLMFSSIRRPMASSPAATHSQRCSSRLNISSIVSEYMLRRLTLCPQWTRSWSS